MALFNSLIIIIKHICFSVILKTWIQRILAHQQLYISTSLFLECKLISSKSLFPAFVSLLRVPLSISTLTSRSTSYLKSYFFSLQNSSSARSYLVHVIFIVVTLKSSLVLLCYSSSFPCILARFFLSAGPALSSSCSCVSMIPRSSSPYWGCYSPTQ